MATEAAAATGVPTTVLPAELQTLLGPHRRRQAKPRRRQPAPRPTPCTETPPLTREDGTPLQPGDILEARPHRAGASYSHVFAQVLDITEKKYLRVRGLAALDDPMDHDHGVWGSRTRIRPDLSKPVGHRFLLRPDGCCGGERSHYYMRYYPYTENTAYYRVFDNGD